MTEHGFEEQLAACARAGDIDGIIGLLSEADTDESDADPADQVNGLMYKWLAVAADFGHEQAEEMIDDVLAGPLHADDDQFVTGHAHFELAVAYLTGRDGLPVDHDLARRHLAEMLDRRYPFTVGEGDALLAEARAQLDPEARDVFDAALSRHRSAGRLDQR